MSHILRIALIPGAVVCAVTGFTANIPVLVVGGMLLVVFFFCIHGKIDDILTSSETGFTVVLGLLAILFVIAGLAVSGHTMEILVPSPEDSYKVRNMLFFVALFFAAQIPCRLYAKHSGKKRAQQKKAAAKNAPAETNSEKEPVISEVRYYDEQGHRCEKEYAVKAEILEYDGNGELINSAIGRVTPTKSRSNTEAIKKSP